MHGRIRGTSSATPIVAGAIVAFPAIQRARDGPVIGPLAMRELLLVAATPHGVSAVPLSRVGPMTDLRAMREWILADNDENGIVDIDELATGRDPDYAESYAYLIAVFYLLVM